MTIAAGGRSQKLVAGSLTLCAGGLWLWMRHLQKMRLSLPEHKQRYGRQLMSDARAGMSSLPSPETLSFTRRRSLWLDQVHADAELSPFTFFLAYALARFFNERQGYAWPSMGRLATECRATKNGVKNAINRLVARGHLLREIRPGRSSTNHFRWVLHDSIPSNVGTISDVDDVVLTDQKEQWLSPNSDLNKATTVALMEEKRATVVSEKGNRCCEKGQSPLPKRVTAVSPTNIKNLIKKEAKTLSNCARENSSLFSFEQFWESYPRKISRLDAQRSFARAAERASQEMILAGVRRYSAERYGKDPQFTKSPARWLDGDGWLDDPAPSQSHDRNGYPANRSESGSGSIKLDDALDRALDQLSKRFRRA